MYLYSTSMRLKINRLGERLNGIAKISQFPPILKSLGLWPLENPGEEAMTFVSDGTKRCDEPPPIIRHLLWVSCLLQAFSNTTGHWLSCADASWWRSQARSLCWMVISKATGREEGELKECTFPWHNSDSFSLSRKAKDSIDMTGAFGDLGKQLKQEL